MKIKTKQFLERAINSLLLSIELFNRPYESGRTESVLINLDHAFEMLMKAVIYDKTRKIRDRGQKYNYGFKKCVNVLKDTLHIIDENRAMTLKTINDLRDNAMHHIISLSEEALYFHSQAAVTLFDDLLKDQFGKPLSDYLPERVLPISTHPPADINLFFDEEFSQIQELVAPGKRKKAEAIAKLRPLIVLENNIAGKEMLTTDYEIGKVVKELRTDKSWRDLFPGIASLQLDSAGTGLTYSLRLTKSEGLPVRSLKEGEDCSQAVAYKEVNLLDRYSLGVWDVADKMGTTRPKTLALVEHLKIKSNEEFFKEFSIGKTQHKRYSPKVLEFLREKIGRAGHG